MWEHGKYLQIIVWGLCEETKKGLPNPYLSSAKLVKIWAFRAVSKKSTSPYNVGPLSLVVVSGLIPSYTHWHVVVRFFGRGMWPGKVAGIRWFFVGRRSMGSRDSFDPNTVLLMEEIMHHLGCIKPYKWWDKLPICRCRISSINTITHLTIPLSTPFHHLVFLNALIAKVTPTIDTTHPTIFQTFRFLGKPTHPRTHPPKWCKEFRKTHKLLVLRAWGGEFQGDVGKRPYVNWSFGLTTGMLGGCPNL